MLTKKDIATVEHAHKLEITGICNYFGHPGTWALNSEALGKSQSPLDSSCFATGGNDGCVKLWELHESMVRLLYVIQLEGHQQQVTVMCSYEMDKYKDCIVVFVESRHFYMINFTTGKAEIQRSDSNQYIEQGESLKDNKLEQISIENPE